MAVKMDVRSPQFWSSYWGVYRQLTTLRPYQQSVRRCLDLMAIQPEGRYLDVPCGMGTTTMELRARAAHVIGLDNSESGLALARESMPAEVFVHGDFHQEHFEAESFDGVLLHNGLYLAQKPETVLCQVSRILRTGGRLVMSNPKPGASPMPIVKEHLAAVWREADSLQKYRIVTESIRVMGVLMQFKPYVDALVGEYGDHSLKLDRDGWARVIELANQNGARLRVLPIVEDGYAGQNTVFVMEKY